MRRSLYKRSNCRSTFCTCFSLHLPDFCPCMLTGTLSCGILALHASPQHLLHLPSCLRCALRGCQPVQAEACSQPGVKAAGSSVLKFLPLTTALLLEAKSASRPGCSALLCRRELHILPSSSALPGRGLLWAV